MGGLSKRGDGYLRRLLVHGGEGSHPMATPSECTPPAMARRTTRAPPCKRRRCRPCKQECPHRLGTADQRGNIYADKTGSFGCRVIFDNHERPMLAGVKEMA